MVINFALTGYRPVPIRYNKLQTSDRQSVSFDVTQLGSQRHFAAEAGSSCPVIDIS